MRKMKNGLTVLCLAAVLGGLCVITRNMLYKTVDKYYCRQ